MVKGKALLPLFLVIPFISHSVDGAVYLACGILRIPTLKFFSSVLLANLMLSISMIFFAGSIKNGMNIIFSDSNHFRYGIIALIVGLVVIVFARKIPLGGRSGKI